MSDWLESFHKAVGDWLDRTLPERRPAGVWRPVARVLAVEEEMSLGDGSPATSADLARIRDLIDRSSLGTPGARQLQQRTSDEELEHIRSLAERDLDESHLTNPCSACGHRARMYTVQEMMELNRMRIKLPPDHPLRIRGCPHERSDCPLLTKGPTRGSTP